jgi:catenin alpha
MADHFGPITLKWDPKNLEIRTMSVEKTLEPLVLQVSLLLGPAVKEFWRNRTCKHFFINL